MSGANAEPSERLAMRLSADEKSTLKRAAALEHRDISDFVLHRSLKAAREVISEAERIVLSQRDTTRLLDLLENPPPPNERLLAAMKAYRGE